MKWRAIPVIVEHWKPAKRSRIARMAAHDARGLAVAEEVLEGESSSSPRQQVRP
jgi:hypothetical protein